ncbi:hypothetical protein AB0A74_24665 [Saccharothrix sp. NPDC042600]|uniref:hypothetical protein n=1 Tax=Saccharothrix TaxID=2071 RepID=UPI0033DBB3C2|nr:hypothetical protein GCM10017745_18230 [Saccharothrix mutabilis subsp. capreolus]
MTTDRIEGDTTAMSLFAQRLTAPPSPPSLGRLGTPPNLSGLFEGIAMSVLDKAATAAAAQFLAKTTEEFATFGVKASTAAATYTAADVTSMAGLVKAGAEFAQKGIETLQQLSATHLGGTQPETTQPAAGQPAAGQPGTTQPAAGQPAAGRPGSAAPAQPTAADPRPAP